MSPRARNLVFGLVVLGGAGTVLRHTHAKRPLFERGTGFAAPRCRYCRPAPGAERQSSAAVSRRGTVGTPSETGNPSAQRPPAWVQRSFADWSDRQTGDTATERRLLREFIAQLDYADAGAVVRSLSVEQLASAMGQTALEHWLSASPLDAARWAANATSPSPEEAALIVGHLLTSPSLFETYYRELPDGAWRQAVLFQAGLQTLQFDPVLSISLAQHMDAGPVQTDLMQTIANQWIASDPGAAEAWIMQVGDASTREPLIAAAAKSLAQASPRQAAYWALAQLHSESALRETLASILEVWSATDPAQADSFAKQLEDGVASAL